MRWRRLCCAVCIAAGSPAGAQSVQPSVIGQPPDPGAAFPRAPAPGSRAPDAWAVALSAVLPGAGQATLGTDRALAYLLIEAFAWTGYVWHSTDSRRQRDAYRDLAARVARATYTPVRPNGNFEYYERMSHYPEAGRYDIVAGGAIDPEPDSTTFNGSVWLLARRTYWVDPGTPPDTASAEWKRAVSFYVSRAYDQLYRWSWTGSPVEYSRFRNLIHRSNEANRRSLQNLGVIIANHVLSTVDAFVTVRLRQRPAGGGGGLSFEGSIPLSRLGR